MPDDTVLTGPSVTVMDSAQATELISSLVTAISGLEQRLANIEQCLTDINTSVGTLTDIKNQLEIDITDKENLNLKYGTKDGVRSIGYILASAHELNLLKIKKAEDEESSGNDDGSGDSDEGGEVDQEQAKGVSESIASTSKEVLDEIVGYECDVTEGERIQFKSDSDFVSSHIGLPFDYTRHYVTKFKEAAVENTEATEYALLVYDTALKTSIADGSSSVNKVKSWDDVKIIQTIVIVENKVDKSAHVYMPSKDNFTAIDGEKYKDVQAAMDSSAQKYLENFETQFKGISIIPVGSIEPGITLEEYRTAVKNIKPACEYA